MSYRTLPPAPGGRRDRRLRSQARLRTYRQVGTSAVVLLIAAGSFTSAGAGEMADAWFNREQEEPVIAAAVTAAAPDVQTEVVSETREVAYQTIEQPDWDATAGSRVVTQGGANGVELVTYTVVTHDGEEVSRSEQIAVVLTAPVNEIVSVGQLVIPPATDVEKGSNRALGQEMAAAYGWTGDQWACLDALWARESGWSHTSHNNSSGAHGIPQALPGSKMATFGADWATNPATQIAWGLSYIQGRYATPCGGWAHFQQKGWY